MHTTIDVTKTLHLIRLVSPALPTGAYAYSQGLESAVEMGWVSDEASAQQWILGLMQHGLGRLDVPVLGKLHSAWEQDDEDAALHWNQWLLASREAIELRTEDKQLGRALARLMADLDQDAGFKTRHHDSGWASVFCAAAVCRGLPKTATVAGYLWAWAENQVAAAIKLVPLGQTQGQRILTQVIEAIPEVVAHGLSVADDDIGASSPGLAMASAWHETQYSRLFRS